MLRKNVKDKGYKEWLEAHGVKQDTAGGYQAASGKNVRGRSYRYEITEGVNEIPGPLGLAVKIFMGLSGEQRKAVVQAYGLPFKKAPFMPRMVALAEENGANMGLLRRRYGNYYGASSNLKLVDCKPGILEIDVHAMNPFSLSLLCEGPENSAERTRFLSLFQGEGFYKNVRILCGDNSTPLQAFKKSLLRMTNRRDTFRLAEPSAELAKRLSASRQDKALKKFKRRQQRPPSEAEQRRLRTERLQGRLPEAPEVETFEYFDPPPPDYHPALTWFSKEFPVIWRKICGMLQNEGPSRVFKEFYLYYQGRLLGAACKEMEDKGIGVCQKHDAILIRTKEPSHVKLLLNVIRENAQTIYEAQPVLRAKFSPGTSEADKKALQELCPDLFFPNNDQTLDPTEFWPELKLSHKS